MPPILLEPNRVPLPGPWWLALFIALGLATAYFALSDERVDRPGQRFWLALQLAIVGGLCYWAVLHLNLAEVMWVEPGEGRGRTGGPGPFMFVEAGVWWVLTWPVVDFRLYLELGTPLWPPHDRVTKVCGFLLGPLILLNAARLWFTW